MSRRRLPAISEHERAFARAMFELTLERGTDWGLALSAYRRAFPESKLSDKRAHICAQELMARPDVCDLIAEMRREYSKRAPVPQSRIMEELGRVALSNLDDFVKRDKRGKVTVDLSRVTREQMSALSFIETTESKDAKGRPVVRTRVRLHPKADAIDKILRCFGAYQDPALINVNLSTSELDRVIEATRRRMGLIEGESSTVSDAEYTEGNNDGDSEKSSG
jgi:hypothetical protein